MSRGNAQDLAVEFDGVRKFYDDGAVRALDGLTFSVARGECVAITGPSGCGKSTMLHLLAALDQPTSGVIRVGGVDLNRLDPVAYRRSGIGLVFQLHNLLPQLSALENVEIAMFGTGLNSKQRRARAHQLLVDVDLAGRENRPPTKLSGGERQRVAIARALTNHAPLLLADEPTGNLDEESVDHVLTLFKQLRNARADLTMLIVTHDARVAASADRVVFMRNGHIDDGDQRSTLPAVSRTHLK